MEGVVNIKAYKLSSVFYTFAVLLVAIPMCIVFATEYIFSSFSSRILLTLALAFVVLGKILDVIKKEKGDKSILTDIGIIIAFLILLIFKVLELV